MANTIDVKVPDIGDYKDVPIIEILVKPGDVITFKEKTHKVLREFMELNAGHNVPSWLEWNPAQLTGTIKAERLLVGTLTST